MNPRTCPFRLATLLLAGTTLAFVAPASGAGVTEAWVQQYNGPGNGDDVANFAAVDRDGNIIVTGSSNNGMGYGLYTAKYAAATGALLWQRNYDIPENNAQVSSSGLVLDSAGNAVVAGSTSKGTNYGAYLAKYAAADGAVLWEKQFTNTWGGGCLALDGNGDAIVAMTADGGAIASGGTGQDYYTVKCAGADGALLWAKRYNGPGNTDDQAIAVASDTIGDVIVLGTTSILKYAASDGALLWEHRYAGATSGKVPVVRMALDSKGDVFGIATFQTTAGDYDFYTAKYSGTNGALLWEKRYNGPGNGNDEPRAVAVDAKGDVVVTGYSWAASFPLIYTAKYAGPNGALLWQVRYTKPGKAIGGFGIAVDDTGNVLVTGGIRDSSGSGIIPWDFYTAKYSGPNGALLWETIYNGPASGSDEPAWMEGCTAVGPGGLVVVAGYSENDSGNRDFITIVYRETLPPVTIAMDPGGVRLRFTGVPDHSYNIERALDPSGPWDIIATPTAPLDGLIEYTDTNPPTGTAFYRTSTP